MGIREDYWPYTDNWGLVHSDLASKGISQNGVRSTAEYLYALKKCGQFNIQDKINFAAALDFCEVELGLLRRHPTSNEQDGPDNQYAALAISKELGGTFAKDWLRYGRKTPIVGYDDTYDRKKWYSKILMWVCKITGYKFNFNNNRPGYFNESAWMGRQPALIAHARVCAGENLSLFNKIVWCAGIIASARDKDSQDGKVLAWFMIKASEGRRSWLMSLATKYWTRKLSEHWDGGIGGVLSSYFTNKNHPSVIWLWDEYAS